MARHSRTRLLAVTLAVLGLLASGCTLGGYRYLDSINWFVPRVDARALQARAQREQPIGGGEAETVAFLRSLDFEDRNIRVKRYAATDLRAGRLASIEAWIPQRQGFYLPSQVRAYCKFTAADRLEECSITLGGPLKPETSGNLTESTPVPVP